MSYGVCIELSLIAIYSKFQIYINTLKINNFFPSHFSQITCSKDNKLQIASIANQFELKKTPKPNSQMLTATLIPKLLYCTLTVCREYIKDNY